MWSQRFKGRVAMCCCTSCRTSPAESASWPAAWGCGVGGAAVGWGDGWVGGGGGGWGWWWWGGGPGALVAACVLELAHSEKGRFGCASGKLTLPLSQSSGRWTSTPRPAGVALPPHSALLAETGGATHRAPAPAPQAPRCRAQQARQPSGGPGQSALHRVSRARGGQEGSGVC